MKRHPRSKNGRITLRDVITHISHVGQRVHRLEDLTATIMDTITIRKHVGIPVPEDG